MTPQEIDDFKIKVQEETLENVIKKITVNDSYFYAELLVVREAINMDNPFGSPRVKVIIKMKLANSKEFNNDYLADSKRVLKTKEFRSEVTLESEKLIDSKEDAMLLVYQEISKQLAADLFQENAHNINMSVTANGSDYMRHTKKQYI